MHIKKVAQDFYFDLTTTRTGSIFTPYAIGLYSLIVFFFFISFSSFYAAPPLSNS